MAKKDREMNHKLMQNRSQRDLIYALIRLSEQKSIRRIAVSELCTSAQVNRSTFYRHYIDMTDFIESITDDFLGDMSLISDCMNPFSSLLSSGNPQSICRRMIAFMNEDNSELLHVLLSLDEFRTRLATTWVQQVVQTVKPYSNRFREKISAEVFASCFASTMLGHLSFHLEPKAVIDEESLSNEMMVIYYDGLFGALGITKDGQSGKQLYPL